MRVIPPLMAEREATGIFDLIASRSNHQLRMGNSRTRPAHAVAHSNSAAKPLLLRFYSISSDFVRVMEVKIKDGRKIASPVDSWLTMIGNHLLA